MLQTLFGFRRENRQAQALYGEAVRQARTPAFYVALGVADRIDARFELYTLHVALLVERLRAEGERGVEVGQKLFDDYVSALDDSLRELGVGDLSVAKKMRRLGEALYGRMSVYRAAFEAEATTAAGPDPLALALSRNVYGDETADAARLTAYVRAARARLAAQSYAALARRPDWPEIEP